MDYKARMAAKKAKSGKKTLTRAKGALEPKAKTGKKLTKKVAKKVAKKAPSVLGKIAQLSAQLILDTGILGQPPKRRAVAKKKRGRKG